LILVLLIAIFFILEKKLIDFFPISSFNIKLVENWVFLIELGFKISRVASLKN
jgi:hypothetical protein